VDSDAAAFAEFYSSARDDCLRVALATVRDRPAAEDLVAEAFTRAWASWRKVSRHPAPRAWVVRTALNAHRSWWRRRQREVAVAGVEAPAAEAPAGGDPSLMAVLRLPLRQRQVIACRLFLDLDTAQTARTIGIASGTVTEHLARDRDAARRVRSPRVQGVEAMDDNDLLAAVREGFSGVRMDTPAEAILADGASLRRRRRRRLAYGSGATALAAAAAISGVTLTSGAASTGGAHDARLTAWTVQEQHNGTIDVPVRDLQNLAALEQKLKADGVPTEVISGKRYPAACVDYKAMKEGMASVITLTRCRVPGEFAFTIHPAGIPAGTRLLLVTAGTSGGPPGLWGVGVASPRDGDVSAGMGLVHANGDC
jgi:DNA-directed RNA polymerase specialized sigma24 family protein